MIHVLGVPFHPVSRSQAVEKMNQACEKKQQSFFVTPNPEICLLAHRDPSYLKILQSADLSMPDGFGILWASRYLSGSKNILSWFWTLLTPFLNRRYSRLPERVTGTDVMQAFCERYPQRRVFLLGASSNVNNRLSKLFLSKGIHVAGHFSGNTSLEMEDEILKKIDDSKAEVLFVAFGAPKQEQWIFRNLSRLKNVRVAMGVGGAFDFLAGEKKRAPKWMRALGLEWLYRVLIEPRRIKRILNAILVFPWTVYRSS